MRGDLDRYAYESHAKAAAATKRGDFAREIIPIDVPQPDGSIATLDYDEGIRFKPNLEKMAQLQPAFQPGGVITAGNASQISDGCAAILLITLERQSRRDCAARVSLPDGRGQRPCYHARGPIPQQAGAAACRTHDRPDRRGRDQ
jgi:acetyl-CoA C-acetyltransferase